MNTRTTCSNPPRTDPADASAAGSLVFFSNGIGDGVINRPALAALAQILPKPVTLVCDDGRGRFLFDSLDFDKVASIPMDRLDNGGRRFDVVSLAREHAHCEVFVALVPWFCDEMLELLRLMQPVTSYGFFDAYHNHIPLDYSKNSVELGFDVVKAIRPDECVSDYRKLIGFSRRTDYLVESLLGSLREGGARRLLAVHTETLASKQWFPCDFRDVMCDASSTYPDLRTIIVDYFPGQDVCTCHAKQILKLPGITLEHGMKVVAKSDAFLGIDSCMMHVADLHGVPGSVLFGPTTRPREFGYFWANASHFQFDRHSEEKLKHAVTASIKSQLHSLRQDFPWSRCARG